MPDAPAPAPAPEQELGQESGLRDLLTTLAGNVQSIQDRGIAAEAKLELLTGQINLVVNATNTNAECSILESLWVIEVACSLSSCPKCSEFFIV